ncbi:MMPL family transporter [Agromyces sp. SYSU K20354]|uniref:MMPL family transporter n=1 Tax=Agromyces cavernae TaxID=2898659 RepID=UPI001E5AF232|nr:MMPL family transporter [Agromyces cavernae]MCD2443996.1 MMPL family transporter [Agromyces cavernae]
MIERSTPPRTRPRRVRVPAWLRVLIPAVLILVWLALFGAGGSAFGQVSQVATNDQSQFLPAESESTRVQELSAEFRGEDVIPAVVVVERDGGLTVGDIVRLDDASIALAGVEGVVVDGVSPPVRSDDGEAVELFVMIDAEAKASAVVAELRAVLDDELGSGGTSGLTVAVTGPAGLAADLAGAFSGIDGLLLVVALAAVFIILVVVYRSPLLPVIVLGTSMAALTVAVLVAVALARADVVLLTGQTQGILFILVIGAATDYSLLYIARFREALARHERKWDATWAALRGSWEPIVASGGTVVAGLLMLLFSALNSNKALGPVAAIGIVCAVLAALTLLPALMLWAGRAAFWPRRITVQAADGAASDPASAPARAGADQVDVTRARGLWPAVARLVARRPRIVWIASTLLLGVMALGLTQLDADGVPQSEFVLGASEARDGQRVLGEHFPAGSGTPALIVAPEEALDETAEITLATDGVTALAVLSETSPTGALAVTGAGVEPSRVPGAEDAVPTVRDGYVMLQATLDHPGDSLEAEAVVTDLRSAFADADVEVLVGGTSAIALDTAVAAVHDRNLVMPLVLGVILLILVVLLRSVVAPLLLVGSVVLSFAAALGVSAIVFDGVFGFPGADPTVPLYGFVFLVALGVDYNIFLMSRVREESLVHGTRPGILRGLIATGGVITSAGIVLAATFAALGVLPILFLAQIAFIVAFGVILDTVLVRSLLIPALSYDIGPAIWWPSKLRRAASDRSPHDAAPDVLADAGDEQRESRVEGNIPVHHG